MRHSYLVRRGRAALIAALGLGFAGTGGALAQSAAEELARQGAAAAGQAAGARPRGEGVFRISRIVAGPSAYLPADAVAALARDLEARGLTSRDIPAILASFDALYDARGIALAQASVTGRDARRGILEIGFVEARVGRVSPRGQLARPEVYAARLGLGAGDLADTRILEDRLLRLAILSGIRSEVAFTPGAQPGLTDIVIAFEEPPRRSGFVSLDANGPVTTGRLRVTLGWSDASLTGNLDPFAASVTLAEGLASGSLSYAFPLGGRGTALFATASAERSRNLTGPAVTGRNALVEAGVSHPLLVAADRQVIVRASAFAFEDMRDTAGVPTTRQSGGGISVGLGFSRDWPDATRLGLDAALRHVRWRDGVLGLSGLSTTYMTAEASLDTPLSERVALTLRAGGQAVAGASAPAQFRGSLATTSRVRGYPSGQLAGDAVVWASAQMRARQPLVLGGALRAVPYAFVDAGQGWDRAGGVNVSSGTAVSAGIGASLGIGRAGTAEILLAKPLRDLPGFSARGEWRLEASMTFRF
ncbi:MAG: ShlB/FhaC/HecB family hemolysin secretion/activation protein [Rhodobacteraceae bacterium]|nr:ShlB/FhaC/HecB family hemolysin secretion/activation protein [Paracoccaceae bacterium]